MVISDDLAIALARLGRLDYGPDASINPILLRVVVEMFLQKRHHAPDELTVFEAIVGPLLQTADDASRRALVAKLFDHPATPMRLLERYMDDETLITVEVYRHASFEEAELVAVAEQGPALVATAIAQRTRLPAAVVEALAARPEPRVALALAENPDAALTPADLRLLLPRARTEPELAECLARRVADPLAVAPLFPFVSAQQRRRILEAVRRMDLGRREWGRPDRAGTATVERLDRLVRSGAWEEIDELLALALDVDQRRLRPLLHDGTGDILALALAAIGVTREVAARAFILGEPVIGRSIAAVRRLTGLVESIAPGAARKLIGAIVEGRPEEPRRPFWSGKTLPSAPRRIEPVVDGAGLRRDRPETQRRLRS